MPLLCRVTCLIFALMVLSTNPALAALCYTKADGAHSAFDTIDARATGSVGLDAWKAHYAKRYAALPAVKRQKTTQERYLKFAAARFKGLDKDRNGTVTCAEYKASIERMKARRLAKAAAAARPPAGAKPKPPKP